MLVSSINIKYKHDKLQKKNTHMGTFTCTHTHEGTHS